MYGEKFPVDFEWISVNRETRILVNLTCEQGWVKGTKNLKECSVASKCFLQRETSTFLFTKKGRPILDSGLIIYECLDSIIKAGALGILYKQDMEEAYDQIVIFCMPSWEMQTKEEIVFLYQALHIHSPLLNFGE